MAEQQERIEHGKVGDVVIKKKLIEVLNALIEPIRTRRKQFERQPDAVMAALKAGTQKANETAEETLQLAKVALKQDYFPRELKLK